MGFMQRERERHAEESTWPIYTNYFTADTDKIRHVVVRLLYTIS